MIENILKLLIPLVFKILFFFLILNVIFNLVLYKINGQKIYRNLFSYWLALVFVFFVEGIFQKGNLFISLSHGANVIPMTILASFLYNSFSEKLPVKELSLLYILGIPTTYLFFHLDGSFFYIALPFCLLVALPLLMAAYLALVKHRNSATSLQKLLGCLFLLMPIHSLNFAIFRMDESTQLWGWFVSWGIFQTLAVILPSFALEEVTAKENLRYVNIQKYISELEMELKELRSYQDDIRPRLAGSQASQTTEKTAHFKLIFNDIFNFKG